MRVLVTGAGGFIGQKLVKALLNARALTWDDGQEEQVGEILVTSRDGRSVQALARDERVRIECGDLGDPGFYDRLFAKRIDGVFHLAAILTAEAEADYRRGLDVNVHGLIHLLERCRAQENRPRFIFPSSIAVFGGPLPHPVDDRTAQTPQTSYGTGKALAELLINDYSRHGFIDGRALRIPIVIIRPKPAANSVADRVGAILREPLLGRDVVCPLTPGTCAPVASIRNTVEALIQLYEVPADRFGHTRAMNMPALSATMAELAEAALTYGYPGPRGRIAWEKDDNIQAIVESWPRAVLAEEALRLGLKPDECIADILRSFAEDMANGD